MTLPTAPAPVGERTARTHRGAAAVGVLGEIMITLGVLLGLFVAWQLWWTDVVADRAQAQVVEDLGWQTPATVDPAAPVAPPVPAVPVDPADPAQEVPVAEVPGEGTTFAVLYVPRWGEDYQRPMSEGVSRREVLDVLGIGHYPGTAMPGEVGNFAVAGHRTTYGKPFHRVEELRTGDPLVVRTEDTWYVYRVTSTSIVSPRAVDVIAPVPGEPGAVPTVATMTMTTCHPLYSARERFIVHAELDHWNAVADGSPAELSGGA